MKINLLLDNPGDVRSGFLNLDPFARPDDPARFPCDVADLSAYVDAGEATEIVALDVLDYFPSHQADTVLQNWLSRLAHGGRLTLSVVDAREVARAILAGTISMDDVNELVMGRQEKDWQQKKVLLTINQITVPLENLGYKVLAKRVQNYRAIVTVERP